MQVYTFLFNYHFALIWIYRKLCLFIVYVRWMYYLP